MDKNINMKENKDRSTKTEKPRIFTAKIPILAVFFVAVSLYSICIFGFSLPETVCEFLAIAVCGLSAIVLILMAESPKGVLFPAILAIFFGFIGGSFMLVSLVLGYIALVLSYSYILLDRWNRSKAFAVLLAICLPALPLGGAVLIFGAKVLPIAAALILSPVPMALALGYSMKKRLSRTRAIFRATLAVTFYALAVAALLIYTVKRSLTVDSVKEVIEAAREGLRAYMSAVTDELTKTLGDQPIALNYGEIVDGAVSSFFNILPGMCVVIISCFSYFVHSLMISIYYGPDRIKNDGEKQKEFLEVITFGISPASALMYGIAAIAMLILAGMGEDFFTMAAVNFMLMLVPGLCMETVGFVSTLSKAKGPSCLGSLLYMLVIFLILSMSLPILFVISFIGAVIVLISEIKKSREEKKNKG